MPAFERVQVMPGRPRIFAVEVTTSWQRLPSIPGTTVMVVLRPRSNNNAVIYVADHADPEPGGLDRMEIASTDGLVPFEIENPDLLYVASASGTQTLEVIAIMAKF